MIDVSQVREWGDIYAQMARLHERDSKMFEEMRANFIRVFQRKLSRNIAEVDAAVKEMEQRDHSPVVAAPQVLTSRDDLCQSHTL